MEWQHLNTTSEPLPTEIVQNSYLQTVVRILGRCLELTDDPQSFLDAVFWVQIALCAVGIAGSTLAAAVCVCGKLRTSCCVQLTCLALYDALFLLACLVLAALSLSRDKQDGSGIRDSLESTAGKVMLALRQLTLWGATYSTLDICAERCLSIACPFYAHVHFTMGFALKRSCVILGLGVLFIIPYVLDLIFNFSVPDGECHSWQSPKVFGLVYTLWITILLLYTLPFLAIVVINVVFAVVLCRLRFRRVRPNKGENSSAEQQLSVLVLSLSAWYAVSMLVPSVYFLIHLTRGYVFQPDTEVRFAVVADTVVMFSCCSNFLFYFLLWRPFRGVVSRWLRGCWSPPLHTGSYDTAGTLLTSKPLGTSVYSNPPCTPVNINPPCSPANSNSPGTSVDSNPPCTPVNINPPCTPANSNPSCTSVDSNPLCTPANSNPSCTSVGSNPSCAPVNSNPPRVSQRHTQTSLDQESTP